MADVNATARARQAAFECVVTSIDAAQTFPEQVFLGAWGAFLFFESDRLFAPDFATTARNLLLAEHASVCCLVNFSESSTLTYENGAKLFLDATSQPGDYDASLRKGGRLRGGFLAWTGTGARPMRVAGASIAKKAMTSA
jgi:hypothetical protein